MKRFSPFDHIPDMSPLSAHQWVCFGTREKNPDTGGLLTMAETGCLDAPSFSPAGSRIRWGKKMHQVCTSYAPRPFDYETVNVG